MVIKLKRLYFINFIIPLFCAFVATAQSDTLLELQFKDGSKTYFQIGTEPKIEFTNGDFVISSSDALVNFPLQNVAKYSFVDKDSGIDNIFSENNRFVRYHNKTIVCQGFNANDILRISDMSGKIVFTATLADNLTQVNISSLSNGIYIAAVQDITIKILVQ